MGSAGGSLVGQSFGKSCRRGSSYAVAGNEDLKLTYLFSCTQLFFTSLSPLIWPGLVKTTSLRRLPYPPYCRMGSYNSTSATLSDPYLDKSAETKLTRRIFLATVVLGTWHPQIPLRSAAIAWPQAILTVQSFCGQEYSHPRCDVESWNSPILENGLLPLPTSTYPCQASAAVSANRS